MNWSLQSANMDAQCTYCIHSTCKLYIEMIVLKESARRKLSFLVSLCDSKKLLSGFNSFSVTEHRQSSEIWDGESNNSMLQRTQASEPLGSVEFWRVWQRLQCWDKAEVGDTVHRRGRYSGSWSTGAPPPPACTICVAMHCAGRRTNRSLPGPSSPHKHMTTAWRPDWAGLCCPRGTEHWALSPSTLWY